MLRSFPHLTDPAGEKGGSSERCSAPHNELPSTTRPELGRFGWSSAGGEPPREETMADRSDEPGGEELLSVP